MTAQLKKQLATEVVEEMHSHFLTVNSTGVAERLWNYVLTPADKAQLRMSFPEALKSLGAPRMWMKARGGTMSRAIVEILYELDMIGPKRRQWLLRQLGEEGEVSDDTMMLAVKTAKLVVVDLPRQVCWEGNELTIKWDKRSALWEYFLAICKATKSGQRLDYFGFGSGGQRTLVDRKNKLRKELSQVNSTLAQHFLKGHQLLDLPRGQIRIFERTVQEELREWQTGKGG